MNWHHFFIPHKETHQKAHLISLSGIIVYILFFVILQTTFSFLKFYKPGTLGITAAIDPQRVIELTNQERFKAGLQPLKENPSLVQAARSKASNMFSENYWAHFSPTGRSPWDFILGAGYKFSYAGENLAKNFYKAEDIVTAWMASPSHRENILNPKYKEIGIAVEDGVLTGENTTLVVQMFGSPQSIASIPEVSAGGQNVKIPTEKLKKEPTMIVSSNESRSSSNSSATPNSVAGSTSNTNKPNNGNLPIQSKLSAGNTGILIDSYQVTRSAALAILTLVGSLLFIDFYILYKRRIYRTASHHLVHLAFLSVIIAALLRGGPGSIL